VLIVVMMIVTLLMVALSATLPSVYQEGQREVEEEVLFRGNQYARAIALFHRQFNRYPVNIKELMGTNNIKFLRREYRDPLDREGKWRFVHANAVGVLIDSKNPPLSSNQGNPSGSSSPSESNPTSLENAFVGMGVNGPRPRFGSQYSESPSSSTGGGNDMEGAFIVGVAPMSHARPIRNCDKRQYYDHWEFLGVDLAMFGIQSGVTCFSPFSPVIGLQPLQMPPSPPSNPPGSPPPGAGTVSQPPTSGSPPN